MERSEQLVSSIRNSDTTRLATGLDHSIANHTRDHVQPFSTESNVSKPILTLFSEEAPGTPVATGVLEARGRSRNVRVHMSTVTLIPPGYEQPVELTLNKPLVLVRARRSWTPHKTHVSLGLSRVWW